MFVEFEGDHTEKVAIRLEAITAIMAAGDDSLTTEIYHSGLNGFTLVKATYPEVMARVRGLMALDQLVSELGS